MSKIMKIMFLFLLIINLLGCSPGLFTRMGSTAPSFGPLLIGMNRAEAERYLGCPITIMQVDYDSYRGIYEYEIERSNRSVFAMDIWDFMTSGLATLIVSPADRFKGTRHLMTIVYKRTDIYEKNDQVIAITNKFKNDPI